MTPDLPAAKRRTILVTGASSGLGRELATRLATHHGADLLLTSRREAPLEALRARLESSAGIRAEVHAADLAEPAGVRGLLAWSIERGVSSAVLNAAVNYYGLAVDQPIPSVRELIATNVTSTTELALSLAGHFARRGGGQLMLVSSIAGFGPVPHQAVYAATKAFLTSFGLALGHELRGRGVSVTVFAPGFIETEMLESTGLSTNRWLRLLGRMSVASAANAALRAMLAGRALAVPGLMNRLVGYSMRVSPFRPMLEVSERLYRARA
jgi:uncharacterized protein